MIQHTVVFRLIHDSGGTEERDFLAKAKSLGKLPTVIDLKVLRQIGQKNQYTFGLSMYFKSEEDYQAYNEHPDHLRFVNDVWLREVDDFLEIDYVEMDELAEASAADLSVASLIE